jgi:hypothetical protein
VNTPPIKVIITANLELSGFKVVVMKAPLHLAGTLFATCIASAARTALTILPTGAWAGAADRLALGRRKHLYSVHDTRNGIKRAERNGRKSPSRSSSPKQNGSRFRRASHATPATSRRRHSREAAPSRPSAGALGLTVLYTAALEYNPARAEYDELIAAAGDEIELIPHSMALEMDQNLQLDSSSGYRSQNAKTCRSSE